MLWRHALWQRCSSHGPLGQLLQGIADHRIQRRGVAEALSYDLAQSGPRVARKVIKGGSPRNPMGVAAMSLAGGEYAIHGTNQPGSIGHFVSYGCIRMFNEDIRDLYERVSVGTEVVVQ